MSEDIELTTPDECQRLADYASHQSGNLGRIPTVAEVAKRSRTLYEIADDLVTAFDSLDLCTTDAERAEVQAMIDRAGAEIMAKADRTAGVLRRMDAEIELCAKEEERLTARRIRIEQGRDWLKGYVLNVMRDKGLGKIKGDTVTLRVQPNGGKLPVVIDDPEQVPDELCWMEGRVNKAFWDKLLFLSAIQFDNRSGQCFTLTRKPSKELIAER